MSALCVHYTSAKLYSRLTIRLKTDKRDRSIKNQIDECVSDAYGSSSLTRNTSTVACVCVW